MFTGKGGWCLVVWGGRVFVDVCSLSVLEGTLLEGDGKTESLPTRGDAQVGRVHGEKYFTVRDRGERGLESAKR